VMECVPDVMPMEADSEVESVSVYFFTESTQTSMRAGVPVMVDVAIGAIVQRTAARILLRYDTGLLLKI
jgi:hypothetical protein